MQHFNLTSALMQTRSGSRVARLALALSFFGVSASASAQTTADVAAPSNAPLVQPAFARAVQSSEIVATTAPAASATAPRSSSIMLDQRAAGLTRRVSQDSTAPAPMMRRESTRTNTALMIVGAAAVILGAAVGDDAGTVLIIGGAGVGLYGLYRFLN